MQVVTALTGTIGSLILKLGKLLSDEYKLQKGLKGQVLSLKKDLENAYTAICEVDACPLDQLDEQVKLWARDIREAAYDMEDALDIFLVRVEGRDSPNHDSFFKLLGEKMIKMLKKIMERHKIAAEIKKIKKRVQEADDRRDKFTVKGIVAKPTASSSTPDPRLRNLYKENKDLIGIDKSRDDVISMLSPSHLGDDRSNEKMIVSVRGAGGLGKTTIAKAVYDKLKEPPSFSCWAFVSIGRNPDLKKVLGDILIGLGKKEYMDLRYKELDYRHLVDEIRDFLIAKRYIIVIDDVWETKTWETIELALVENNRGTIIIITTRKSEVCTGKVYNLQSLPDDSSRKLFCKRLFDEDKFPANEPPEVNEASDKILKKCGGVPLAIITMASLLRGKPREEWFEVCNKISFIEDKDTMWILSLSFSDLPPHLRTCLLYLSAFPEDYVIDKDHLIRKWVAEGFVLKEQGMRLFEVGEGYFNDLVNRSMIQAAEFEELDAIIYGFRYGCQVHDMVLDLLRDVSSKLNFFTVPDNVVAATSSSGSKARRLAIQNISGEHSPMDNQLDMSKVRSFMAFKCHIDKCISFRGFKLLRVLVIEYCRNMVQLGHLGRLIHLRYLGIIGTSVDELPEEIGYLNLLQTVLLKGVSSYVKELPSSFGRLKQLVCLRATSKRVRSGVIGSLTCLEELEIQVDEDDNSMRQFVKDLSNLTHLRVLIIEFRTGSIEESDLLQSLGKLQRIQHLDILSRAEVTLSSTWCTQVVLPRCLRHLSLSGIRLSSLPLCISPSHLVNLSHLELEVGAIDEQALESLSRLPQLRYLSLYTKSTVTLANVAADGFFQMLRCCNFSGSTVLFVLNEDSSFSFTLWNEKDDMAFVSRKVKEENQHRVLPAIMPNLQELTFSVDADAVVRNGGSCDSLGLEYLSSLRYVCVHLCWLSVEDEDKENENMEKEEAALKRAIEAHPNHPTLEFD